MERLLKVINVDGTIEVTDEEQLLARFGAKLLNVCKETTPEMIEEFSGVDYKEAVGLYLSEYNEIVRDGYCVDKINDAAIFHIEMIVCEDGSIILGVTDYSQSTQSDGFQFFCMDLIRDGKVADVVESIIFLDVSDYN